MAEPCCRPASRHPVYARLDTPPDEEMKEALLTWHVRACTPGLPGCDLRVRRLTCPSAPAGAGVMPAPVADERWPLPLYGEHRIMLRLRGFGRSFDITLSADPSIFLK